MTSPVEQAIAAAKAAQAAQAAVQTQVAPQVQNTEVATVGMTNTAVAIAGPKLSMGDVAGASMSVDAWFKPDKAGLRIGDSPVLIKAIKAVIDMTDGKGFVVKMGIKGGNPAQYAYTQDNSTCTTGGSWEAACQRIRALAAGAAVAPSPYRCVDLPFTVPADTFVKVLDNDVVKEVQVATAGQTLGYTTSTTNWKAWELFHRAVETAGLMGHRVLVELGAEARINKAGNEWGTMTFKLIGDADEELAGE